MLFNSLEFAAFLPVVLACYFALSHRWQNRMLLAASYVFYGWWDHRFLLLILISTVIDYCAGLMIHVGAIERRRRWLVASVLVAGTVALLGIDWRALGSVGTGAPARFLGSNTVWAALVPALACAVAQVLYRSAVRWPEQRRRRAFLVLSVATNLGLLGIFKYFNFFAESATDVLTALGVDAKRLHLNVVLPVGISFYTFQTLSYTIDIYRRRMKPTGNFIDFALFVAYFPQLVAGPVERAQNLIPRLSQPRQPTVDLFSRGAFLILLGLFKKVAIADGLAGSVDSVYASSGVVSWLDIVAATLCFAGQIYGDFSGYSDIARGTSKLLGIELMLNFKNPHFSTNPSEFWQRWHISLSSWLRDYLYIFWLGGNRGSSLFVYRNLMLTMVLGGLWHGAAWNFVLWGFYQGAILCIHRLCVTRFRLSSSDSMSLSRRLLWTPFFFAVTCYGWLLFRAESLSQAVRFTALLVTDLGNFSLAMDRPTLSALAGLPLLVLYDFGQRATGVQALHRRLPLPARGLLYALFVLLIVLGCSNVSQQFIYFQF